MKTHLQQQSTHSLTTARTALPGTNLLLVLSILALILPGIIGAGIAIAVLILVRKRLLEYEQKPGRWLKESARTLRTARTLSIISLCLSALVLLFVFVYFLIKQPV